MKLDNEFAKRHELYLFAHTSYMSRVGYMYEGKRILLPAWEFVMPRTNYVHIYKGIKRGELVVIETMFRRPTEYWYPEIGSKVVARVLAIQNRVYCDIERSSLTLKDEDGQIFQWNSLAWKLNDQEIANIFIECENKHQK